MLVSFVSSHFWSRNIPIKIRGFPDDLAVSGGFGDDRPLWECLIITFLVALLSQVVQIRMPLSILNEQIGFQIISCWQTCALRSQVHCRSNPFTDERWKKKATIFSRVLF